MLITDKIYAVSKPSNSANAIKIDDFATSLTLSYKPKTDSLKKVVTVQVELMTLDDNGFICPPVTPSTLIPIAVTSFDYLRNGNTIHIGGRVQKATALPGGDLEVRQITENEAQPEEGKEQTEKNEKQPEEAAPKLFAPNLPVGSYISLNFNIPGNIGMINFFNPHPPQCDSNCDIICNNALIVDYPELEDDGSRSMVPYSCRGQYKATQPKPDDT